MYSIPILTYTKGLQWDETDFLRGIQVTSSVGMSSPFLRRILSVLEKIPNVRYSHEFPNVIHDILCKEYYGVNVYGLQVSTPVLKDIVKHSRFEQLL